MHWFKYPPCSQHLWETLGYLPIGEMWNFAGRGIFMWLWESEEERFWSVKPLLKLKNNILQKFPQLGLKWNFAGRRIFFIGCWKFEVRGQVIEYNKIFYFYFQKFCRKWPVHQTCFCSFKSFIWIKCKRSAALFHYTSIVLKLVYNKKETVENFKILIQRYTQFWFLESVWE